MEEVPQCRGLYIAGCPRNYEPQALRDRRRLVNGMGNPWVSPAGPIPVPVEIRTRLPMHTGTGFVGTGDGFRQPGGRSQVNTL